MVKMVSIEVPEYMAANFEREAKYGRRSAVMEVLKARHESGEHAPISSMYDDDLEQLRLLAFRLDKELSFYRNRAKQLSEQMAERDLA